MISSSWAISGQWHWHYLRRNILNIYTRQFLSLLLLKTVGELFLTFLQMFYKECNVYIMELVTHQYVFCLFSKALFSLWYIEPHPSLTEQTSFVVFDSVVWITKLAHLWFLKLCCWVIDTWTHQTLGMFFKMVIVFKKIYCILSVVLWNAYRQIFSCI